MEFMLKIVLFGLCLVATSAQGPDDLEMEQKAEEGSVNYVAENRLGNPEEWGNEFQSDILLPPTSQNGIKYASMLWPNKRVPFKIGSGFTSKQTADINAGVAKINEVTGGCVQFIPRTTQQHYVQFTKHDSSCSSYIGTISSGSQPLKLADWCFYDTKIGTVLHEMLHALGFGHEHTRLDRDSFVDIKWNNIRSGTEGNFKVYTSYFKKMGTYDYGSVLHYSKYAGSNNGLPTIVTKQTATIGQRDAMSAGDIAGLKSLYSC